MLDRLISLNALRKEVERNFDMQNLYLPVHILDVAEDVEEGIVRCKDCKWFEMPRYGERGFCKHVDLIRQTTFYCADGERR